MREEIRDIERLQHMLEAMDVLIDYKEHHTLEEAQSDPVIYFGLVKHVEIIGEAVYKLTLDYRTNHPEVNWNDIERMRHVLVHGYYKIRPIQPSIVINNMKYILCTNGQSKFYYCLKFLQIY